MYLSYDIVVTHPVIVVVIISIPSSTAPSSLSRGWRHQVNFFPLIIIFVSLLEAHGSTIGIFVVVVIVAGTLLLAGGGGGGVGRSIGRG